jgi:hypothetical protein
MHYCSIRVHSGDTPMVGGRCVTPGVPCDDMPGVGVQVCNTPRVVVGGDAAGVGC